MTPRQAVLAAVEQVGGEFGDWSGPGEFRADAWTPPGLVWVASGCHVVAWEFYSDRPAGWRAALDDVRAGVRPCDQTPCDVCDDT